MGRLKQKLRELAYGEFALRQDPPRQLNWLVDHSETYRRWVRAVGRSYYNDPELTITKEYPEWHREYNTDGWWMDFTKFHGMYFNISTDFDSNCKPPFYVSLHQFGANQYSQPAASGHQRQYWNDLQTNFYPTEEELIAAVERIKETLDVIVMEATL